MFLVLRSPHDGHDWDGEEEGIGESPGILPALNLPVVADLTDCSHHEVDEVVQVRGRPVSESVGREQRMSLVQLSCYHSKCIAD